MANKSFEHTFEEGGGLSFQQIGGKEGTKPTHEKKYEVATVGENVYAVSYLGSSGYTLTSILDFRTMELVAFASNEKSLVLQHGTFEVVKGTDKSARKRANGDTHSRPHH
jgi:hypothetical protein